VRLPRWVRSDERIEGRLGGIVRGRNPLPAEHGGPQQLAPGAHTDNVFVRWEDSTRKALSLPRGTGVP